MASAEGRYFENSTLVTSQTFCEVAQSDETDIEKTLDTAHAVTSSWSKTAPVEWAVVLNKIADHIEEHTTALTLAES
ncbi:aldehyde dehydrogenase family protein [Mycobacterium uberis]|uniref:aldehyde dehydrogenase family protein n=1 Tax=Mycobacterium uberis TaxID=2162698 RepID=UPI001FB1C9D0|nr:aldehyde dehydrogenase family protein [Mycobacterium uberis]